MTTKVMREKVLGINIDDVSMEQTLATVTTWLQGDDRLAKPKIIVTPGPEFLVTAQKDEEFKRILNTADLSIPDGFGLHLAGIKNRVPGVDLMLRLCELSAQNGWQVGLLGGMSGVAQNTASELIKRYPNIKIAIIIDGKEADRYLDGIQDSGYKIQVGEKDNRNWRVSKFESDAIVDLLFVAFGHPKQEKLLAQLKGVRGQGSGVSYTKSKYSTRYQLPAIRYRVGMGVGGSFDFISGRVWEPGGWISRAGLKWLGRLISNPRHFHRVIKATIIFPLLLAKEKIGF